MVTAHHNIFEESSKISDQDSIFSSAYNNVECVHIIMSLSPSII